MTTARYGPRAAPRADVRCSVVVPAHNEAAVIAERLGALMASVPSGAVELVVVANGCTDDTVGIAKTIPGVRVVELSEASKTAALNRGDREATAFPRIYLDADIRMSGESLLRLAAVLSTDLALVAAPRAVFDVTTSSWPVRAFYTIFGRLPYAGDGLVGLGVYGLSEAGRRRFGPFPDVVADDLYVQRLFPPDRRVSVDASFHVVAPRTVRALLSVRTRVARGNRELADRGTDLEVAAASTTGATLAALLRAVIRRPGLFPAAVVYAAVTMVARSRARRTAGGSTWERDDSSRSRDAGRTLSLTEPGGGVARVAES